MRRRFIKSSIEVVRFSYDVLTFSIPALSRFNGHKKKTNALSLCSAAVWCLSVTHSRAHTQTAERESTTKHKQQRANMCKRWKVQVLYKKYI